MQKTHFAFFFLVNVFTVQAGAVTLSCTWTEQVMRDRSPPLEIQFNESGSIKYGADPRLIQGEVTESMIKWNAKEGSDWYINRRTGEMFIMSKLPGYESQGIKKIPVAQCESADMKKF